MKLTPLEIEGHQFGVSWRGYDQDEVRTYLAQVSLELTQLLNQHQALQEEHRLLKERLQQTDGYEERLRDAILMATQLREQVRDEADREAQVIIREAELRAEELMAQGRASVRELHGDILSIRAQRRRVSTELRATLESHLKLLNYYEEELDRSLEEETPKASLDHESLFDDEALKQAQELTLLLGEDLVPPSHIDHWPQQTRSSNPVKEPVKAKLKPRATEREGQIRQQATTQVQQPHTRSSISTPTNPSLHSSEMLQQVLSQIPQRVDPRELSLPPQAIKAEG